MIHFPIIQDVRNLISPPIDDSLPASTAIVVGILVFKDLVPSRSRRIKPRDSLSRRTTSPHHMNKRVFATNRQKRMQLRVFDESPDLYIPHNRVQCFSAGLVS